MTQSPIGGPAQTIYQVTDRKGVVGRDAVRVVVVTDGRPAEGGPQQAAYFVSDAEIAAGEFIVTGNKPLAIVKVDAQGAEYPPIAVYYVTGKADDAQPTQDVYTLTVTTSGSGSVSAAPSKSKYASGDVVTLTATPSGGATFSGWSGDASGTSASITLTINGDKAIAAAFEGGSGPTLPQVASATLLLDLRASQLSLTDGDPVSTWPDASGNGRDFTQTGDARPIYKANDDGHPAVYFDGLDTLMWMLGPDFADNLDAMAIFVAWKSPTIRNAGYSFTKLNDDSADTGWYDPGFGFLAQKVTDGNWDGYIFVDTLIPPADVYAVHCAEFLSKATGEAHAYINGDNSGESIMSEPGGISGFSNSEPVRLGATGAGIGNFTALTGYIRSGLIYQITDLVNWPTDRAAIEAWLATNP